MLIIEVNNVESKFLDAPSDEIVDKIRNELRYKNDADNPFVRKKFMHKNAQVAEYKYLYHKGRKAFPTGLLDVVEKILKDNKCKYQVNDKRPHYPVINPIPMSTYVLRDYQDSSKQTMLKGQDGICRIATGGGKTAIMTAICADLNGYKRMIFVRRQMLLLQTIRVLERELGVPIGQVGAGVINIQDLTVMMIPTVARAVDPKWKFEKLDDDDEDDDTKLTEEQKQQVRDYVSSAQCMIIDECHCLGAETAQIISKFAVGARYRLGFSATDWRDDGKDILLTAATGSRKVDISASYLIERNYLVPPHIYFLQTPKVRLPHFMQGQYQDVYKEFVVENEERNQLIIDKALEAYNRFEKVVILVKQIEHGKIIEKALLDEGAWVDYISGKSTAITREDVIRQFQNRSRSILIGSSILDEGVDIPEISVLINAGGGKSSAKYYQQIGRAIRLAEDKKRAIIIDFIDNDIKFMRNHSKARIKLIKTESLYKLKIQGSMDE